VETLQKAGYHAYLVGGCVRDLLLGYNPKDFDVSTSALPEEIRSLFSRCFLVGKRFRLAHVRLSHKTIEVSTFRKGNNEKESLIIQHNEWGTEEEDVLRRDFTINGLFYNPKNETIIDYVDGYIDAKKFYLRVIGNPFLRFKQDPVRMIRLIKFRARFGITVDPLALEALFACRSDILKSSQARVLEEFLRMLQSGSSESFIQLLSEHGILSIILPRLAKCFEELDGNEIYIYLGEIDRLILTKDKMQLHRSQLLSVLVYPILKKHLAILHENLEKAMHLGEIHGEATFMIKDLYYVFC